jgi:hypothetical protein
MNHVKTFEGFFSKIFGNDAISIAKKMVVGTSDQDGVVVHDNKKPVTVEFDGRNFTEDQIVLTDDANSPYNKGFEQRQGILPRIVGKMSADVENRGKLILPKGKLLEIWLKTRGVKN